MFSSAIHTKKKKNPKHHDWKLGIFQKFYVSNQPADHVESQYSSENATLHHSDILQCAH